MLDLNFIRNNPGVVKQACQDKQLEPQVVDDLLEIDQKRRFLKQQVDEIRRRINNNAEQVEKQVHQGSKPDEELIEKGRQLKNELKKVEPEFKEVQQEFEQLMLQIPNIPADDVPISADESGNKIMKQVGELPQFDFTPLPHDQIMEQLDWLDTERGVKIGGFRSYFLKNKAVLLEQAILRLALDYMVDQGFTAMTVPVMVKQAALIGTGFFPWGKEDHYQTQDNKYLTGTAEVALTSYYMNETLVEDDLPIKLAGLSPCYRREVGAHGKDTQGVIRVHQFNKVEQVVLTKADQEASSRWHKKMISFSEELLQQLGLPYQMVLMSSGDMGAGQHKKYDLETWFPSQNCYRETHSASSFHDFQTRRLKIKYQAKDGQTKFAYSLNNTVLATPRLLAAIVENCQQADGTVKIPKILQKYL